MIKKHFWLWWGRFGEKRNSKTFDQNDHNSNMLNVFLNSHHKVKPRISHGHPTFLPTLSTFTPNLCKNMKPMAGVCHFTGFFNNYIPFWFVFIVLVCLVWKIKTISKKHMNFLCLQFWNLIFSLLSFSWGCAVSLKILCSLFSNCYTNEL